VRKANQNGKVGIYKQNIMDNIVNISRETIIIASIFVFSFSLHAEIYKCNSDGIITYKDIPCTITEEELTFDSSKILGLEKPILKDAMGLACTLDRLKKALTIKLNRSQQIFIFCGVPANVTKSDFLKILPNAVVLDKSPQKGMKFLKAITDSGYMYRVEWGENEDVIRNATLFSLEQPRKHNKIRRNNDLVSGIKTYCKQKWPANYRQQAYCIKKEKEAMYELAQQAKQFKHVTYKYEILKQCMMKWQDTKNHSSNYRQTVYCIKKEILAYDRIN